MKPLGFGVLYAVVKKIDNEKGYVGKHKGKRGAIDRFQRHIVKHRVAKRSNFGNIPLTGRRFWMPVSS